MSNRVVDPPMVRRLSDWSAARLRAIADTYGTPVYVYDLDRVLENYHRFADAFDATRVHYAAKANTARCILAVLANEGAGVECASGGEVARSIAAGFDPRDVLYTAVNPPSEDLDYVAGIDGVTITVGAEDTVDRLAERGYTGRLCVRVNPGIGAGHHVHVRTGSHPKFGIPENRVCEVLTDADYRGFDVVGLHAHAGSGITYEDLETHLEFVTRVGELARGSPIELDFINIGGGFGVPSRPDEEPLDIHHVARVILDSLGEIPGRVLVEPGRYIVADAGVLVTRVNTVKETDETVVVGVDAGMTTLIRPALYDAYHHIENLAGDASDRATRRVMVAGPVCESADVFARNRSMSEPQRGDVLGIGTAGAYGMEMASHYNSRPKPAIVAIDGDKAGVVSRRETIEDITRQEQEVEWL